MTKDNICGDMGYEWVMKCIDRYERIIQHSHWWYWLATVTGFAREVIGGNGDQYDNNMTNNDMGTFSQALWVRKAIAMGTDQCDMLWYEK